VGFSFFSSSTVWRDSVCFPFATLPFPIFFFAGHTVMRYNFLDRLGSPCSRWFTSSPFFFRLVRVLLTFGLWFPSFSSFHQSKHVVFQEGRPLLVPPPFGKPVKPSLLTFFPRCSKISGEFVAVKKLLIFPASMLTGPTASSVLPEHVEVPSTPKEGWEGQLVRVWVIFLYPAISWSAHQPLTTEQGVFLTHLYGLSLISFMDYFSF